MGEIDDVITSAEPVADLDVTTARVAKILAAAGGSRTLVSSAVKSTRVRASSVSPVIAHMSNNNAAIVNAGRCHCDEHREEGLTRSSPCRTWYHVHS